MSSIVETVEKVTNEIIAGIVEATPRIIVAIGFVVFAYIGIKIILVIVRSFFNRTYPDEENLIAALFTTIIGIFLWFSVGLIVLKLLKMDDIAASIGTSTGFIALGVSYALSNMIADTVAGVYLLRDPDFNPGDRVSTDSVTGTVKSIELRKSRIEKEDGNIVVLANRDVEKKWTKID